MRRRGWTYVGGALLGLALVAGGVAFEVSRAEQAMVQSAHRLLERTFGSSIVLNGDIEASLLPRPRLLLHAASLSDEQSSLRLDMPLVEALPTIGSVLLGHATFAQIRLIEPTAVVDGDHMDTSVVRLDMLRRVFPGKIVVSDGVVALRSVSPTRTGLLTGFDAVLEGMDRNGPAALAGHAVWRGQHAEITARLDPIFDFMLGRPATGSVRFHLPALSASIDGKLHNGAFGGFDGTVTVSTSSLDALLRSNGVASRLGATVGQVGFTASGVAGPDAIMFSNAHLTVGETNLEGSLAWQPNGGHGAWTGTFATEALDLTGALRGLAAWDRDGGWSDTGFTADSSLWGDIDLRVSAGQATLGSVSLEDAAFSALCRNGRVEVGLSEARAADGMVRGRAVATLRPAAVDLKLDLSMAQFDLEPLGWSRVAGVASGNLAAQARGASPRALVADLIGHGQVSIRQGSLPAPSAMADFSATTPPTGEGWTTPLSFDLGTADLAIANGIVGVANGRIGGPDADRRFAGQASLLDRAFSFVATEVGPDIAVQAGEAVTSSLSGLWGRPPRVLHMQQLRVPAGRITPVAAGSDAVR